MPWVGGEQPLKLAEKLGVSPRVLRNALRRLKGTNATVSEVARAKLRDMLPESARRRTGGGR